MTSSQGRGGNSPPRRPDRSTPNPRLSTPASGVVDGLVRALQELSGGQDEAYHRLEDLLPLARHHLGAAITLAEVHAALSQAPGRFEVREGAVRLPVRRARPQVPPDVLYHATHQAQVDRFLARGEVYLEGKPIFLSIEEPHAWRAAHRFSGDPRVLYVDSSRARRRGIRFQRQRRNGLWQIGRLDLEDVLNLQPSFAEQISAGGIPVARQPDGSLRLALIRVHRRSGATWEVAKGKLELGESPEAAAVREVQEEMGLNIPLQIRHSVGQIRYGFMAPGGLPRLKTVFLYLMEPQGELPTTFVPAHAEGIGAVRWFEPEEACRAVTHPSLVPAMRRVRQILLQEWR